MKRHAVDSDMVRRKEGGRRGEEGGRKEEGGRGESDEKRTKKNDGVKCKSARLYSPGSCETFFGGQFGTGPVVFEVSQDCPMCSIW